MSKQRKTRTVSYDNRSLHFTEMQGAQGLYVCEEDSGWRLLHNPKECRSAPWRCLFHDESMGSLRGPSKRGHQAAFHALVHLMDQAFSHLPAPPVHMSSNGEVLVNGYTANDVRNAVTRMHGHFTARTLLMEMGLKADYAAVHRVGEILRRMARAEEVKQTAPGTFIYR